MASVVASVIQGSGLGPACYIVAASDLLASHAGNVIIKFADDTYLIVPSVNSATCHDELDHVRRWAADNNLQLNLAKSKELLIMSRGCRRKTLTLPSPCPGVDRDLTVLGVQLNDRLTVRDHISGLLASCARQLYALRVLRPHGLPPTSLQNIYHATVMAKLL